MKMWVNVLVISVFSMGGLIACHDTDPIPDIPGLEVTPNQDRAFITDSFEREEIFENPDVQTLFGWRGFIWDFGTPVLGLDGDQVDAVIFNNDEVGSASDGEHALYFYGRSGTSVHNLYLISQRYDLSHFNSAVISFDYLTFGLNDPEDLADGVEEYLKVEICTASVNECGVNEDILDVEGLNGDNWLTLFDHRVASPDLDGLGFDGQNHTADDWRLGQIAIDLNNQDIVVDKASVIIRFTARMRDGLSSQAECEEDDDNGNGDIDKKRKKKLKKKLKKKRFKLARLKKRIKRKYRKLRFWAKKCHRDEVLDGLSMSASWNDDRGKDKKDRDHFKPEICDFKIDKLLSKISELKKLKEEIGTWLSIAGGSGGGSQCEEEQNANMAIQFEDGAAIDNVNALGSPLTLDQLF